MAQSAYWNDVQKAYIAYYGRPGDWAGMNYWSQALEQNGGNLSGIIQGFGNSVESQSLYAGADYRTMVQKIYQQLFGRDPDPSGWDYYVGKLEKKEMSLQSIALDVLNGAQGSDKAIIDAKVAVANLFTQRLHDEGADYSYMGEDDAQAARALLAQVDANTDVTSAQAKVDALIAQIHDDVWAKLNVYVDDMTFDGTAVFIVGDAYAGWQSGRGNDVWVAKLDPGLSVQKTVWLGDVNDQYGRTVAPTGDGGVVVTGYQYVSGEQKEFISKLDANLNSVGTVMIGATGTDERINDVAVRPDGKIVAVGYQNAVADARDAYIVALNPDMTVFAQRRVDNPNVLNSNESFDQVAVLPDNSVVVRSGDYVLQKFDANLNLVKTVQTSSWMRDMAVTSDGSVWVIEGGRLMQLTSDLQWAGEWSSKNFNLNNVTADGSMLTLYGGSVTVTVNVAKGVPVIEDVTQVTTRSGGTVYFDQAVLKNGTLGAMDGSSVLMTLRPEAVVSPNLASDYRETDLDVSAYGFNAVTSYKATVTPLDWAQGDVQIVGVANSYTTKDASGLVTVNAHGTLDA